LTLDASEGSWEPEFSFPALFKRDFLQAASSEFIFDTILGLLNGLGPCPHVGLCHFSASWRSAFGPHLPHSGSRFITVSRRPFPQLRARWCQIDPFFESATPISFCCPPNQFKPAAPEQPRRVFLECWKRPSLSGPGTPSFCRDEVCVDAFPPVARVPAVPPSFQYCGQEFLLLFFFCRCPFQSVSLRGTY